MTNNTEALRKEFEEWFMSVQIGFPETDWNEVSDRLFKKNARGRYEDKSARTAHAGYQAAHASQKKVIDSLRAENERLKKVDDGLERLIAILNRKGHDHLTLDYLIKSTGKSAT